MKGEDRTEEGRGNKGQVGGKARRRDKKDGMEGKGKGEGMGR
jgi:hypothetical protein